MKIRSRAFIPLAVAVLSLGFLSGGDSAAWRKIACLDPSAEEGMPAASYIQLESDLFKQVRSEADEAQLKKSALEFYNILSQNELRYYLDAQSAQSAFGIKTPLFSFSMPTIWGQYQSQLQGQDQSIWKFGTLGFNHGPQLTNLWGWNTAPASIPSASFAGVTAPATVIQPSLFGQQALLPAQKLSVAGSAPSNSFRW